MKKIMTSTIIAASLLIMSAGTVFAQEATPITGTVQNVEIITDSTTGESTVKVDLIDADGNTQTVNISLETAQELGLVTIDPNTNEPVVSPDAENSEVEIDPTTIINEDDEDSSDSGNHPVATLLESFFGESTGVDYDTIMSYHEDGAGFGIIAQALWMTNQLGGDADTFNLILDAKQTGDYSGITLPDGSTPTNWGQFKKAVMENGTKSVGHAKENHGNDKEKGNPHTTDTDTDTEEDEGEGNGNNGNGHGNGNNNGNNNGNGKGNGHGKP